MDVIDKENNTLTDIIENIISYELHRIIIVKINLQLLLHQSQESWPCWRHKSTVFVQILMTRCSQRWWWGWKSGQLVRGNVSYQPFQNNLDGYRIVIIEKYNPDEQWIEKQERWGNKERIIIGIIATYYLSIQVLWWCWPPALPRPPEDFLCLPIQRVIGYWGFDVHCIEWSRDDPVVFMIEWL